MKNTLSALIILTSLFGCTQHASMTTAQIIKDLNCDEQSKTAYKRCDTNIEEEYKKDQEMKRELEEEIKKEQELEKALRRANQQPE